MNIERNKTSKAALAAVALLLLALSVYGGEDDNAQAKATYMTLSGEAAVLLRATVEDSEGVTDWIMPDTKTTTSVMTLINSNDRTVTFDIVLPLVDGNVGVIEIRLNAFGVLRFATDPVSSFESHWRIVNTIDIGSKAVLASAALPAGVKIDGYVAWGSTEKEYDPALPNPVLPIRFMPDKVELPN